MKHSRLALVAAALLATAAPVAAQAVNPLAARESQLPAVLSWLQTSGVSLTYIGDEGGLRGYLGQSADGKMQTFYVTPDNNHVVAGVLFKNGGTNLTGVQIGEMRARFDAAAKGPGSASLGDAKADPSKVSDGQPPVAAEQPKALPSAVDDKGATAAVSPISPENIAKLRRATEDAAKPASVPAPSADSTALTVPAPTGPVDGAQGDPSAIWVSKLDRKAFLEAVDAVPYFEVGALSAKPLLFMVADPKCPFCHKTWDAIRPLIYDKKLRVRVILINALPGSEPAVREILASPQPARKWLDTDAGRNIDVKAPSIDKDSPEWASAGAYMAKNMEFAKRFGIDRTPLLAYVGKNGTFYSALGLPGNLDSFMASLGAN